MAANSVSTGGNAQMLIIDPAYLPTHSSRQSRSVIVSTGCGLSFLLGLLLMIVFALFDDRIYDRIDVQRLEQHTAVRLLGVVPPASTLAREKRAHHG